MIKKSKGLKTKFIDKIKFKIAVFQGQLAKDASALILKMLKSIQKARGDISKKLKIYP